MAIACALKSLGVAGFVLAGLAYPAAWGIDRAAGLEVLPVVASDAASVETNRGLWALNDGPKADVPGIYGTPAARVDRIVFSDAAKVLHPKEDPSLTLYLVSREDQHLQAQTLWYFALPMTVGGLVAGTALLLLGRRMGRRAAGAAPTPASS